MELYQLKTACRNRNPYGPASILLQFSMQTAIRVYLCFQAEIIILNIGAVLKICGI